MDFQVVWILLMLDLVLWLYMFTYFLIILIQWQKSSHRHGSIYSEDYIPEDTLQEELKARLPGKSTTRGLRSMLHGIGEIVSDAVLSVAQVQLVSGQEENASLSFHRWDYCQLESIHRRTVESIYISSEWSSDALAPTSGERWRQESLQGAVASTAHTDV